MEKIFAETIKTAKRTRTIEPRSIKQTIVDTTVMEKNICYPTDGKLYHRMRKKLVSMAKIHGIELRQSYTRKSKRALLQANRYFHARQMRRGSKQIKKIKIWLGRVVRDIQRKIEGSQEHQFLFNTNLELARKLLAQEKKSSNMR